MKNALSYYYGLDVNNIHQKDKTFYFKYENFEYVLTKVENTDIEIIYELANNLNQIGVYCHQIIPNNNKQIITKINDEDYVLMKMFVDKDKINLNDIINFNNINYIENKKLTIIDWYTLWSEKIDYFEYQISQIGKKYPVIRKSFSYYIGLSENAITLVKNIPIDKLYYSLNHRRINYKDNMQSLYNPLSFIIDIRFRDVCEYFKSSFFNKINIENEIMLYLYYNDLNYNESCYFFARMLFPTYYFDIYEKIINNEIDEIKLNSVISLAEDYEILLKKIYLYLKNKVNLPNLEWLIN